MLIKDMKGYEKLMYLLSTKKATNRIQKVLELVARVNQIMTDVDAPLR